MANIIRSRTWKTIIASFMFFGHKKTKKMTKLLIIWKVVGLDHMVSQRFYKQTTAWSLKIKIVDLVAKLDGDYKLIYGKLRHPQSHGLVEQATGIVEKMIAAGMEQFQNHFFKRSCVTTVIKHWI